ncbi:MAG: hypothetical protein Q9172_001783 [Xanthocarpia lactea]
MPDAWDDDWVQKADTPTAPTESAPKPAKVSKAERRAKQAEFNRQLWEDAYENCFNRSMSLLTSFFRGAQNQEFFLNSRTEVPLKSEFKPAMQVLSRKPAKPASTSNLASGLGQLSVDDEDDDEEDEAKTKTLTAEERQLKAQKEREEKQKKYDVARERILGNNSAVAGKSSGNITPPRGKVNGSSRGPNRNKTAAEGRNLTSSPTRAGSARQLYDPNYTAKPDSAYVQKDNTPNGSGRSTPIEQQPIRNPRGPDGSGRGGFGFAPRGGKV